MIALHHGGPGGHSASVLIALAEKGLAFEDRPIDLGTFGQHAPAFLDVNPAGQVPVLREDDRSLTEAFFILLYLDERYPAPSLGGEDPRARYAVQKWGKYVETHIAPNLAMVAWAVQDIAPGDAAVAGFDRLTPERRALWQRATIGFSADEIADARAAIDKAIARVAEDLGPWLGTGRFGIADICVFPHIVQARALGFALPAPVVDWLDRVASRPAVQHVMSKAVTRQAATMGPERGRWG